MKPLVSIIMPVYQVEQYVRNSVKSICEQTYGNLELIIVNDGTQDNSVQIIEEVILEYNFQNYILINQQNKGVSAARNIGIRRASGDWCICIDSDDCISKDYIDEFIKIALKKENDNIDIIICSYRMVDLNGSSIKNESKQFSKYYTKNEIISAFLYRRIIIILPAILIRKEFLIKNSLYFDEQIRFSEDQMYIWKILFCCKGIIYNNAKKYYYLRRPNSTMTSSSIHKILGGYVCFRNFVNGIPNQRLANLIISRWVFGVVHSSAKMMNYNEYKELLKKIDYKMYMLDLRKFKDKKVCFLSHIFSISKSLTYHINRIV